MSSNLSIAAEPLPFTAYYDARFKGFKAQAEISLTQLNDTQFIASSLIKLKLLGATVSTIRESSQFDWYNDKPRPNHYEYSQSGIGSRSRSIEFYWQKSLADSTVENDQVALNLEDSTVDEMSMYSLIRTELKNGNNDITFNVVDQHVIEEYRYRVIGEEAVETNSGVFNTLKVERVRENNNRLTQLWFAKDNDMLLVKLYQRDPDGDEFDITLNEAYINGELVQAF